MYEKIARKKNKWSKNRYVFMLYEKWDFLINFYRFCLWFLAFYIYDSLRSNYRSMPELCLQYIIIVYSWKAQHLKLLLYNIMYAKVKRKCLELYIIRGYAADFVIIKTIVIILFGNWNKSELSKSTRLFYMMIISVIFFAKLG